MTNPDASVQSEKPGLLRALGPGMAIAIVVGNVIGSGIFAKPGEIAAAGRTFPLIITAWIVGGVLSFLGALCFAELSTMLPQSGGMYVYLQKAYGRCVGFLQGWSWFLFTKPASLAALSMIFVEHLEAVGGISVSTSGAIGLAVILIGGLALINVIGVLWGGWVQNITTVIKVAFVLFVACLPYLVSALGHGGFSNELLGQSLPISDATPSLAGRFAVVLLAVMWAYNGWHGITPVAEEIRDPGRNIPRALLGGTLILTVLYVSANVAYHGVVPMVEMAEPENQERVAVLMFDRLLGPRGAMLIALGVMVSTFGAINSNMLLGPRVPFAMGRDDPLLRWLGAVNPRFRTPARAIVLQAIMGVLMLIGSACLVRWVPSLQGKSMFAILTGYIIFASSLFYMLTVAAVLVLRRKMPTAERPFRCPTLVPFLYLAFYSWFLYHVYQRKPVEANIGILLNLSGLPVFVAGV
ncbi:MAG: amino acid permease, partial [Pirellulaceae bacterium]|nr:amino acid permease [Pirellulaceae bacterium]